MTQNINIAIAGLGTVGQGVVNIIRRHPELLAGRSGKEIKIVGVSARNRTKKRNLESGEIAWYENPLDLLNTPAQVIVELMGGDGDPAFSLCKTALQQKKHVVTANKALIAKHGIELAAIAEQNGVQLLFEAAVAGGIPVIKTLKEGLAGNNITRICGILNGTCNYILSTMQETKREFSDILKDAQDLGYAEADPAFDVEGIDTAHKLSILSAIAFGTRINFQKVYIEGIRNITPLDIEYADEFNHKIKLLGIATSHENHIGQVVYPCLLPKHSPLAKVDGVDNAILIEGDAVGKLTLQGPGAGSGPTASAVLADIVDIASNRGSYTFNLPVASLRESAFDSIENHKGKYYIRITALDRKGVLADITEVLKEMNISMRSVYQQDSEKGKKTEIVGITHETAEKTMNRAIEKISQVQHITEKPHRIRVEE